MSVMVKAFSGNGGSRLPAWPVNRDMLTHPDAATPRRSSIAANRASA